MKRIILIISVVMLVIILLPGWARAAAPQETLNQYIADLQKNPSDNALREKIIKHVQTMTPKPSISEGAREHFVIATTIRGGAKDVKGYELAIQEYKNALLAAPWWPDALKELAIVQKMAEKFDDAIQNLSLYVLTQPPDARDAQDEIYKLKAAKMVAQTKASTTVEKPKPKLDVSGRWRGSSVCDKYYYREFRLDGDNLFTTFVHEDKTIRDSYCQALENRRGQRTEGGVMTRSGKNEFRTSQGVVLDKIEFIGDKAFWSTTVEGSPNQSGSGIFMRER